MVRVGQPNSARNLRNVCGERAAQVDAVVREFTTGTHHRIEEPGHVQRTLGASAGCAC